jgi:hypothetical protein
MEMSANKEASTLAASNCERLVAEKKKPQWLVLDVKLTLSLPKF